MTCPGCGTENPASAAYCSLCQRFFAGEQRTDFLAFRARNRTTFVDEERSNRRKSRLLLLALWAILAGLGAFLALMWGWSGEGDPVPLALLGGGGGAVAAAVWSSIALLQGDRIVLTVNEAVRDEQVSRRLQNVVEELSIAAGIRPPEVRIIETPQMNAFATGVSGRATVAITRGLLEKLDRDELQGVMAHEIAHVRNGDVRLATEVAAIAGMVVLVSDLLWRTRHVLRLKGGRGRSRGVGGGVALLWVLGLVFALLAPLFARAIQFAISRRRELLADASAVALSRQPDGLVRALLKLGRADNAMPHVSAATAHLFLVNPHHPLQQLDTVFATHPPLETRIERLVAMGAGSASGAASGAA